MPDQRGEPKIDTHVKFDLLATESHSQFFEKFNVKTGICGKW